MFRNYLKIFVRTLIRQKVYSFINIAGLAIGISCFLVLSLFVLDEIGFDYFNVNGSRIYRVLVHSRFKGEEAVSAKSAVPIGQTLMKDYPEVLSYARIGYTGSHDLRYMDKKIREYDVYTADSTFFDLFTLPFLYGDPKTALRNPNSLVLSETASLKYFGAGNPVGRAFIADDTCTYLITGVMKDFPKKAHFGCNFLLSMSTDRRSSRMDWLNSSYTTYILVREGADIHALAGKMDQLVMKYVWPQASALLGLTYSDFVKKGNAYSYILQPLSSIYLRSQSDYSVDTNTEWGQARISNISYSYIFMAVGLFILLIAVFNFMNLATAKSEKRAREVGIRKTLGSDRSQLIVQFLAESIFTCMIAVVVAVALTELVLPLFNNFVNRDLSLPLMTNVLTIPALILLACVVGILAGSYPALYLSSIQPAQILRSGSGLKKGKRMLRSILVIVQFAISITLIIGTIIIKNQLEYIQRINLGFNKEAVISISNGSVIRSNLRTFHEEIAKFPSVLSSTASSLMFASGVPGNGYFFERRSSSDVIPAQMLDVDDNFLNTYQMTMKEGRFFSPDFGSDSTAVVINEAMAKRCNDSHPIGKILSAMTPPRNQMIPFTIVGVVKDFNFESLHKTIRPLVLHLGPVRQASTVIAVRISTHDAAGTIASIEEVWKRFAGAEKMNSRFLDENLARMYRAEQRMGTITTVFSILAIIIACLGLFGLVSFVTEQKTKEIGIRKVLGASVVEIIALVAAQFMKWVLYANLISWPIAYLVMTHWLNDFAYRTDINVWVFVLSGLIAFVIAIATVIAQVLKVATQNPVTSLRYE